MSILITAIKSTGESNLIVIAPEHLLDAVQKYCERRNRESIEAGLHTSYKYEKVAATIVMSEYDLD